MAKMAYGAASCGSGGISGKPGGGNMALQRISANGEILSMVSARIWLWRRQQW